MKKDSGIGLFKWSWATLKPEKFRIYNKLLTYFVSDEEVSKMGMGPKILLVWHLYTGALQDSVLNGKKIVKKIVKNCPLTKKELKTLFS